MGLGLSYNLHAPEVWPASRVQGVVAKMRARASEQGFAEVDQLWTGGSWDLFERDPPGNREAIHVESSEGFHFRTWPGESCETAFFGMYRYPAAFDGPDGAVITTGWGEGWHFESGCKTHPADRISREHFLRCHLGVIAILDTACEAGLEVNVGDDFAYWADRNLSALHRELDAGREVMAQFARKFDDLTGH